MALAFFLLTLSLLACTDAHTGFGTSFSALGKPYGACGVPQAWLVDANDTQLPFVALNTQLSPVAAPGILEPVDQQHVGEFDNGHNCGRWIHMTLGKTCKTGGMNTNDAICITQDGTSGVQNYVSDEVSDRGDTLYGYVADKCSDANVWCRTDRFHVDVSANALEDHLVQDTWGNRLIDWHYIEESPVDMNIQFGWSHDSYLPDYTALIVYGIANGISNVTSRNADGLMVPARMNGILGQMWVLPPFQGPDVEVEVFDVYGNSYGTWAVNFPCSGVCNEPTKAVSTRTIVSALVSRSDLQQLSVIQLIAKGMEAVQKYSTLDGREKRQHVVAALQCIAKGGDGISGTTDDILPASSVAALSSLLEGNLVGDIITVISDASKGKFNLKNVRSLFGGCFA